MTSQKKPKIAVKAKKFGIKKPTTKKSASKIEKIFTKLVTDAKDNDMLPDAETEAMLSDAIDHARDNS